MRERSLSTVPKLILIALIGAVCAQVVWNVWLNNPLQVQPSTLSFSSAASSKAKQLSIQSPIQQLSAPPSLKSLQLASFGEPIALSKLLMLYLQAFDNQAGQQIPFSQLDYQQVQAWLSRIIHLDPSSQYPLFLASRLYGEVGNPEKQRVMLEFVYQEFLKDPNQRWTFMAHAATLAKHRLKDMTLAKKYAHALRLYATGDNVPSWAKQMEIFILEDMNELQSAQIILGGLLQSGKINDANERQFLEQRLIVLENKINEEKKASQKNQ